MMPQSQEIREKQVRINGLEVNYKIVGQGPAILILHGWGRGSDSWSKVQISLASQGYCVAVPDLPGFGKSMPPQTAWGVKEYMEFTRKFADAVGFQNFFLVGHSFGGQIAALFAATHTERLGGLILAAAAVIRRKPEPRQRVLRFIAKAGNVILAPWPLSSFQPLARKILYRVLGSHDHIYSQGIMKKVHEKVVREDMSHILSAIACPTLVVWGDGDSVTPLEDGRTIQNMVPGASLAVLPGVSHRISNDAPERLSEIILRFVKGI